MKLKVFVDANLSLKVYRPLHPKRVTMTTAHFTTTPCKPYTVPKVQGKPHFSARLNTLRAPKVRALRIKGRFMYAIFLLRFDELSSFHKYTYYRCEILFFLFVSDAQSSASIQNSV